MILFRKLLTDNFVQKRYVNAGSNFGDAVSYSYMGECVDFEFLLNKWAEWEKEYSRRGYRTVSIDDFVQLGGYGESINHLLRKKREQDEEPVIHAEIYRQIYLGKIKPVINIEELTKEPQIREYILPSTKIFLDREENETTI